MADRGDQADLLRLFPATTPETNRAGLLVHDAGQHGSGIFHVVSVELVADKDGLEGGHGMMRLRPL